MTRRRRTASLAGAIVIALCGCATQPVMLAPGTPREVRGQALAAREIHEECAKLRPGDVIEYRFESSAPVDFNIHYHEGKAVVMPLSRDNVRRDGASFRALTEQDYCLMWETGTEATKLDYRIVLVPRRD